ATSPLRTLPIGSGATTSTESNGTNLQLLPAPGRFLWIGQVLFCVGDRPALEPIRHRLLRPDHGRGYGHARRLAHVHDVDADGGAKLGGPVPHVPFHVDGHDAGHDASFGDGEVASLVPLARLEEGAPPRTLDRPGGPGLFHGLDPVWVWGLCPGDPFCLGRHALAFLEPSGPFPDRTRLGVGGSLSI